MTALPPGNAGAAECGGCALRDAVNAPAARERREFLRAAGTALASIGLLGLGARESAAASLRIIAPVGGGGDAASERRYPIPAADGVSIDKDNSVIIARAAGRIYAFSLACPHQNTAVRWNARNEQFQCPKHKSRYRGDGTFISGRATRSMDRLPIRRDPTSVIVDIDTMFREDEQPAQWAAAFVPV